MHKIMKLLIKIFLIIVVLAGVYSCEDPLKEIVYFELTEDLAFGTQEDALAAINSIYEPLIAVTNRDIFYLNDIASDGGYRANENAEILNFNKLNESQDVVWSWEGYYTIISRANIAIPNIEKIEVEKFYAKDVTITDQVIEEAKALKARYLAEAHFLRAWAYYQLTDIFYKVPLNLTFEKEARNIPLSSIEDIEAQIISDLLEAEKSLPETYPTNNDAGRATIGAAQGMLCRVYMRAAGRMRLSGNGDANTNWQKALTYANKVLALESKGVYVLQKRVWDIFNPDLEATKYNKELIFAVRSNPNSNFGTSDIGMNFTPWNYDMGWNLINIPLSAAWQMDMQNDERFTKLVVSAFKDVYEPTRINYVMPPSIEKVGTLYKETPNPANPAKPFITKELDAVYTKKYKYQRTGTYNYHTGNNMPVLRLADIILCKAEILNELNSPTQESIDLINRIRQRAFQSSTFNLNLADYPSKEKLREAICDERFLEFNSEGMRRPDLIRMGLWKDRMDKYITTKKLQTEWEERNLGAPDLSDKWKVYPQDLTENDKRRYFPIPKKETDINPELLKHLDDFKN